MDALFEREGDEFGPSRFMVERFDVEPASLGLCVEARPLTGVVLVAVHRQYGVVACGHRHQVTVSFQCHADTVGVVDAAWWMVRASGCSSGPSDELVIGAASDVSIRSVAELSRPALRPDGCRSSLPWSP